MFVNRRLHEGRRSGHLAIGTVQCQHAIRQCNRCKSGISEGYNYRVPQNISSAICNSIVQSAIYTLSITVHEVGEGTMDVFIQ